MGDISHKSSFDIKNEVLLYRCAVHKLIVHKEEDRTDENYTDETSRRYDGGGCRKLLEHFFCGVYSQFEFCGFLRFDIFTAQHRRAAELTMFAYVMIPKCDPEWLSLHNSVCAAFHSVRDYASHSLDEIRYDLG